MLDKAPDRRKMGVRPLLLPVIDDWINRIRRWGDPMHPAPRIWRHVD